MKQTTSPATKVTIFDVAKRACVSIKTVSRVVNRESNVRPRTREKVLQAIEALDYRPNVAARGLSSKRSYVVGLIYENADEFSYTKDILNGAFNVCEASGYTLLLRPLTLANTNITSQVKQFLMAANVAGVLLPAPVGDLGKLRATLEKAGVPYATISPKRDGGEVASVHCDDRGATFALTEFLLKQGHKNIGFIKGHPDHAASGDRLAGYRSALRKYKIAFNNKWVIQGYFDFASGRKAAGRLLDMVDAPGAILASSDDMAAGAMFEARERGLSIPADISIVGFDDTPVASRMWPQLTTVRQPILEMAEAATKLLIAHLQGREVSSPETTFACELVIRQSAAPVQNAAHR